MTWDRRGRHATGPTGDRITWSLAEGARGTRWREAVARDGALIRSLLLEVTPAGAVARLEITTVEGLLTLHPEPDASAIHGNVVTATGIRHLALDWSPVHELIIDGSPTTDAVLVRRRAATVAVGSSQDIDVVAVDDTLHPRLERWTIERVAPDGWRFRTIPDGGADREIRVATDGLPILDAAATWTLEG